LSNPPLIFTGYKKYEIWHPVAFEALCFPNGAKYREPKINPGVPDIPVCLIPKFDVFSPHNSEKRTSPEIPHV